VVAAANETIMNPKELKWLSVLASLLAVTVVIDSLMNPSDQALGQAERLFPKLAADSIEAFTVTRGTTNIVAQKTNGQWRVANPDYPAHPERLQRLAMLLSELTLSQRITEADWTETGDETTFGLNDEARATVRWKSRGKEQSIEVGAPALFGRQTYVRLPGTRDAILVDSDLANWVPNNADDWRDLRLVPENLDFDSLRFWGQSRTVQLNLDANGTWQMKEPTNTGADQSVILQLIKRMQLARIVQIATNSETPTAEPDATVRLAKGEETLIELVFRKPEDKEDPNIWVTHSTRGRVAIQDDGLLTLLRLPHDQFRNHAIFRRPLDEVTSVTVNTVNKFTVTRQKDNSWWVRGKRTFKADTLLVNNMLGTIRDGQVIDFVKDNASAVDFEKEGLDNPWMNLKIDGASATTGAWSESVAFGTFDTSRVLARLNTEPTVVALPRAQAILLPKEDFKLRDRRLWSFATNQVAAVTITFKNKPTRLLRLPNATWRDTQNKALDQVQSAMLEESIYRMGVITAVEWIGEGDAAVKAAEIKPGNNQIVAEVDMADGPQKFTLIFGNKDPLGRTRVMTPHYGQPTLFTTPSEFSNIYIATLQTLGLTRL